MQFQYAGTECQPQPRSVMGSGSGFVHHVKGLGDLMTFLLRNTDTFIPYLKIIPVLPTASRDLHRLSSLRGLDGIVDQIDQYGLQQILIGIEFSFSQRMSTFTLLSSGFPYPHRFPADTQKYRWHWYSSVQSLPAWSQ